MKYLIEVLKYVRKIYSTLQKELDDVKAKLDEICSRLDEISARITKLEREIAKVSKTRKHTSTREENAREILESIKRNLFVETKSILNKRALKELIDSGKVILLRDEVLNLEIATTPEIVRRILAKLPKDADKVAREFSEREYELLRILNRLGYVLIRDNRYVVSELAREFLSEEEVES